MERKIYSIFLLTKIEDNVNNAIEFFTDGFICLDPDDPWFVSSFSGEKHPGSWDLPFVFVGL
jgi:hypothetical protein